MTERTLPCCMKESSVAMAGQPRVAKQRKLNITLPAARKSLRVAARKQKHICDAFVTSEQPSGRSGSSGNCSHERGLYTYEPLLYGHIRVLKLQAGEFGSPLVVHIEQVLLGDEAGDYEALSYTWGTPVFEHELFVRGQGLVRITESLHTALQYIRQRDKLRYIWADAVCINQENDVERSAQVILMREIYL